MSVILFAFRVTGVAGDPREPGRMYPELFVSKLAGATGDQSWARGCCWGAEHDFIVHNRSDRYTAKGN